MLIVCAWCEKDGTPSLLAVRASDHIGAISHGICTTHATRFRQALRLKARRKPAAKPIVRMGKPRKIPRPLHQLSLYHSSDFDKLGKGSMSKDQSH
jgi:hypothetical protein